MKSKRILIALHRFEGGGAERQAVYLAEGLLQRGYSIEVIAFGKMEGLAIEWFKAININPRCTGFNERILLDYSLNIRSWWLRKKYSAKLIEKIRSLKVDVIIPFTYPPNVIFATLWRKINVEKCFWNQRDGGVQFLSGVNEVAALNNVTSIISNSLAGKNFLKKYTSREIAVIHNGIKQSIIRSVDEHNELRVIMIANIHRFKDHLTLLKAWKEVINRKENVKLLLAGMEGDTAPALKQFVIENFMEDTVLFLGQVKDIPSLLSNVQVGVFSSINEGVPNGILECMNAGLPVVATRINGSVEALGENYYYLSEPNNDRDLFEKLMLLLEDHDLRATVGKANRLRVQEIFSTERMVEKFIKIIESE